MNPEAIIAMVVAVIAVIVLFSLRRITANFTARQVQSNLVCIQSIMIGFMIWIYFPWLEKWGPVGILAWIGLTTYLIGSTVFAWRRFAQNWISEDPADNLDRNSDTTSDSN